MAPFHIPAMIRSGRDYTIIITLSLLLVLPFEWPWQSVFQEKFLLL